MPLNVSIIMPTYRGGEWLDRTLAAIRNQNYGGIVEIIAVDSSSPDNTVGLLQNYGAIVIPIDQVTFSHGFARNLGVQHAQYPIVVFMSQDALPSDANWLAKLVALLDDASVGAAYARQLPRPGATPLETFFHLELYPPHSRRFRWDADQRALLDKLFFSNVCSISRRELCLKYPFDETLIMSEDQAFAKAMLLAGYQTLYSAEVTVIHSHNYDLKTLFRRNFDSAYSLRGITSETFGHTARLGIQYVLREVRYVVTQRRWRWLGVIPFYELARVAGRIAGKYADHFPRPLRMQLSLHRQFWTRKIPNQ